MSELSGLASRLLAGFPYVSRDDGVVHRVGPSGWMVAEVCVYSSGHTRLNLVPQLHASAAVLGITLEGGDRRFPGAGVVVTDSNVEGCRHLIAEALQTVGADVVASRDRRRLEKDPRVTPIGSLELNSEERESLRTAYAVVGANLQTSRSQEWQLPAIAMSAESILVLASTQTHGHHTAARVGLGILLVAVWLGTTSIALRLAQGRRVDSLALDAYEELLLPPRLRLSYSTRQTQREALLRERLGKPVGSEPWVYRTASRVIGRVWAGSVWLFLQGLLTVGGLLVVWYH